MGQKLSVSRTLQSTLSHRSIPDDLCRPNLYTAKSDKVDLKKLKSLVKTGRIAPFHVGRDEEGSDCVAGRDGSLQQLEECAICMLCYPVLNSSSCCAQRLCSDCFVQIQTTAARPGCAPCPFCKEDNFAVRFLGAKSSEDWERERQEEQRVVEAKHREHQAQVVKEQQRLLDRYQQQQDTFYAAASDAHMPTSTSGNHGSSSSSSRAAATHSSQQPRPAGSWSPGWQQVMPDVVQEAVDGASVTHHMAHPVTPAQQPHSTAHIGFNHLRRLMAADFIPASMVEMHGAVTLDDLNQLMLEQALMASLAADANSASNSTDAPAQGPHTAVQAAPRQGVPTVA